ncbi:hypothetical protein SERN_1269 [Serinibacter arcticus]|uniref:Uncharacterized protein n=1 Tax=Serinibacter arcticus TaxID=1655435 RepID=A0A4Z1DZY3_9MICO|nr:hypothetical protein SERN_1269 [Serinibacter arcticus]
MSCLDLRIPGDPDHVSVTELAVWLDSTLQAAVGDAAQIFDSIRDSSTHHWQSWSGESYRNVLVLGRNAGWEVEQMVADTAEKLHSYAGQLERLQGHLDDHRDAADAGGLTRTGTVVQAPVNPVGHVPDTDDPRYPEYSEHLDRVDLFNGISTDVGTRLGDLEVWVTEHLEGFLAGLEPSAAVRLLEDLSADEGDVVDLYVDAEAARWRIQLPELQAQALDMRTRADQALAQIRAQNDQVGDAIDQVRVRHLGHGGVRLQTWVDDAAEVVRALPVVGAGIGWILTASGLAQGDDAGATAVEIVVGGAAGLAVGGLLAAAGAGVVASVGIPALVVVGVGGGAAWIYEETVPQQVREEIDAGWRDFVADGWEWLNTPL